MFNNVGERSAWSTSGACRPSYSAGHQMPFSSKMKAFLSVNWDIFICKDINVMHTPLIFSNRVLFEAVMNHGVLIIVAVCDLFLLFFFLFFSNFNNAIGLLVWKAKWLLHWPALWRSSGCVLSCEWCEEPSTLLCRDRHGSFNHLKSSVREASRRHVARDVPRCTCCKLQRWLFSVCIFTRRGGLKVHRRGDVSVNRLCLSCWCWN